MPSRLPLCCPPEIPSFLACQNTTSDCDKAIWTRVSSMDVDRQRNKRDEDEENGAASSDEEGIDLMNSEGDSSEEEEDEDPEEEARIREGKLPCETPGASGECSSPCAYWFVSLAQVS